MTFRFIHTADWQLGRAFRAFEPGLAGQLEAARFDAIDQIAHGARERGATHVLVAGDVFDGPDVAGKLIRQGLERMRKHTGLSWVLLPGNHDTARAGGIWDRVAQIGVPDNVRVLLEPRAHEVAPGVYVLAAPLFSKSVTGDPTAYMDTEVTPPGALRIGLAHGSVIGFGSQTEASIPLDPGRTKSARLDYLALGDWHGMQEFNARVWYAGTPEPDRFPVNEPGYVLAVTLEGAGDMPTVERHRTAHFTWVQHEARLSEIADMDNVERAVMASSALSERILARVVVTGTLPASQHTGLDAWLERMEGRVKSIEVDRSGLGVSMGDDDLAELGQDAALATAAARLQAMAQDASAQSATARAALAQLFVLTRRAREDVA
jgi:DNA repair exonuclease SbcCD nuclease subunit